MEEFAPARTPNAPVRARSRGLCVPARTFMAVAVAGVLGVQRA